MFKVQHIEHETHDVAKLKGLKRSLRVLLFYVLSCFTEESSNLKQFSLFPIS